MDEEDIPKTANISVFTPIIYLIILLSCFIAFSIIYRRRTVRNLQKIDPIFEENYPLIMYSILKDQYNDPNLSKEQKPHEKVMKAALLRRGVEAIRRSLKLKESESVYKSLYENGLIGDDIFKQYNIQVKFQELEIQEIARDCELYKKGWTANFFKVAQEVCFNEALRRRILIIEDRAKDLSDTWEYYEQEVEKIENIKKIDNTKASGVEKNPSA
ncbi:translocation protein Sec66p [[Candida] jaroonii]|uniref:Translocation protein Sec66p n=1 Tax=[Candida] jaroonii TaxID=467808 RepID=A0ACA9Y0T6_9ASCO|nr:translocation protein Sec66p [[Candida] jaroonii]